jgi:hypothetical protein
MKSESDKIASISYLNRSSGSDGGTVENIAAHPTKTKAKREAGKEFFMRCSLSESND